jgi:hypothetical protein
MMHKKLFQWLAPIRPEAAHVKALFYHQPGTSTWFIQGPLQHFLNSEKRRGAILWLKGKCKSSRLPYQGYELSKLQRDLERQLFCKLKEHSPAILVVGKANII